MVMVRQVRVMRRTTRRWPGPATLGRVTEVLLVTCAELPAGERGGELLVTALAERGVTARWVRWDDPGVDWSAAALVAVRSTWDYDDRREEFLAWAEHVERWSTLLNGAAAFRWNTDKGYLLDLERAGVPVVPTAVLDRPEELAAAVGRYAGRVVVKPRVGAGGRGVVVLDPGPDLGLVPPIPSGTGPWIVQPVMESVRVDGELSVFVLGGVPVSQARKVPAGGELRVQEEYGGATYPDELGAEAGLLAAEAVAAATQLLGVELGYARVDLMWSDDATGRRLLVSELELTEPGLYLDVLPGNAGPFADLVAAAVAEADAAGAPGAAEK